MNQVHVSDRTYVVNRVFSAQQQTAKDMIMRRAEANRALTNRQPNVYNPIVEMSVPRKEAT